MSLSCGFQSAGLMDMRKLMGEPTKYDGAG